MMSSIRDLSMWKQQMLGENGSFNNDTILEETSDNETQRVESQGNASLIHRKFSNISQTISDPKSRKRSSDPILGPLQKNKSKISSRNSQSPLPLTVGGNSETIPLISQRGNSSEEDSVVYHSDASRAQQTTNQRFDIAFLHADVLVYEDKDKKIKSMNQDQQLSADVMYQQLIDNLVMTKKGYRVLNRYFNAAQLKDVLVLNKPRLLFLNCHGGIDRNNNDRSAPLMTYLSCENQNIPTLQSRLDENQLSQLVKDAKVQLVVISACHSSRLGQVLINGGIPVVVSINATDQVLEKAAEIFNRNFLKYILQGESPKNAFNYSIEVLSNDKHTSGICCCLHNHKPDCLWFKYKENIKDDFEAHKLHMPSCKCAAKCPDYGPIDHRYDCRAYKNFYTTLTENESIHLVDFVLNKCSQEGFLRMPGPAMEVINKMCCCQSDLPHNESQKFQLLSSNEKAINEPIFDPKERLAGKVFEDLPINFKDLPTWLYKESNWLQDRNLEIHKIVDFLISKNRILKIYGQQLSGRTAVTTRAIKIVLSRNQSAFRDGVDLVDLENVGMSSVITRISERLRLCQTCPEEESLCRDLMDKKRLIVFRDCQMTSSKQTQARLISLIQRIINSTHTQDGRLKFIVIMQESFHNSQLDREQSMTIEPMSRYGKIQLFIQLMAFKDKTLKFIESETKIRQHPIFDLVDANYIQILVNNYQNIESLDQEETKVTSQLEKQKPPGYTSKDPNNTKIKGQDPIHILMIRGIVCANLLQNVPAEYRFEKNFIFFLTLTPAGISETEFVQLTSIYKSWFGTKFQLLEYNLTIQVDIEQPPTKKETKAQTYLDLVESNTDQDLHISIFKVSKEYNLALKSYLDHTQLEVANTEIRKSRSNLVSICIEFMGSQARSILRSIRQKERLDYRLVSAHLDCGMWWRYPNEEEHFDQIIEQAEQRFASFYLTNFKFLLDEELLTQNFPDIWSGQTQHESEYITDLCLTVPSILVQLKRFDEAEEIITQCRQFGGNKVLRLHGYLDLMLASIYVYNNIKVISDRPKILQLIQSARAIFKKFNLDKDTNGSQVVNAEELAETYFVEATLHMQVFKNQLQQQQHSFRTQQTLQHHSKSSFNDQNYRRSHSQTHPELQRTQSEVQKQQYSQDIHLVREIKEALDCALSQFERIDDNWPTEISNKQYGKAKTILAEGDFFINHYTNFTPQELNQIGFNKDDMLKNLERAGLLFSDRCQKSDDLIIRRSSSYEAGIQLKVESSRNYEALTICLRAQLKLSIIDNKKPTPDEIAQARDIIYSADKLIDKVDDKIDQTIREIKNRVLNEMRFLSNNLFTFAKAWPLVHKINGQVESIGEFPTSRFDLAPKIHDAFDKSNLDLQINFDIFNEELLKSILESGSRVLHLSSDIFSSDSLFMEDKIGMCKELKITEMEAFFKSLKVGAQFNSQRLPVSCVVLAMPESQQIGKKFFQMGVPHVVCFDLNRDPDLSQDVDNQLMPFRFNYIYAFVQKFYISLVKDLSVKQAFEKANEAVQDGQILFDKIWELRDLKNWIDLGINPILIDKDNIRHNKILFDRKCLEREDCYIAPGHLSDCSKQRGLLVGVKKSKDPYIGHKTDLYSAMVALTDQSNVNHLCHVRGRKGTGKTRFLKEVAYYLYQRGYFQFKIHYQDMLHIKTEQAFKEMLQEKNLYEDMRGQSPNAVQILLIFDNIDMLPKEIDKNFEGRLIDLIQRNSGIRFLTSSTKNRHFEHFQHTHTKNEIRKQSLVKMVNINLRQLAPTQAIDLLLQACKKEISRDELDLDDTNPWTIQKQLMNEKKFMDLDYRPENILEFAKRLENNDFKDIKVKVNRDYLKNTSHHHIARPNTKVQISVAVDQLRNNRSPGKQEELLPTTYFNLLRAHQEDTLTVNYSQSETPDLGRSRAGSYAIHQVGTEVNINEHIEKIFLMKGISQIPHNSTEPNEILEEADYREQDTRYFVQEAKNRDRLSSDNIQGELFESKQDRIKVSGAKQQKNTKKQKKLEKKETPKLRNVDKFKKPRKKYLSNHKPTDNREEEPVEADYEETKVQNSSQSPTEWSNISQLTPESTEKKQKKIKKLTKQQKEEMEWEDIQQKSGKK